MTNSPNLRPDSIISYNDEQFMKSALQLANNAYQLGEVPVGAVMVYKGKIIASGYNRRETDKNSLRHAEIDAIDGACRALGGWRLSGCTLYVTLEPCPMCAGAIINSRIGRVVYGASDAKAGAFGSVLNMNFYPLNHKVSLTTGVCEEECRELLQKFFLRLREKRNKR